MATQQTDLSQLKHALAWPPLHLYYELMPDGKRQLRHIRANQVEYQVPADGSSITIDVPGDSVGTEQIKDGSIERADLSEEVRAGLIGGYDSDSEQLTIG